MRSTRKRLNLRDLVIAIVFFAISLKLGLTYSRSSRYWKEAKFYERARDAERFLAKTLESETINLQNLPSIGVTESASPAVQGVARKQAAERSRKYADQLDRMRSRYQRAAFLPWLPDTPDPPSS